MEGPLVKYMIMLILLFDGTLVQKPLEFTKPVSVMECLSYADDHRKTISTYKELGLTGNAKDQGWYLNDGSGTWQGVICTNIE